MTFPQVSQSSFNPVCTPEQYLCCHCTWINTDWNGLLPAHIPWPAPADTTTACVMLNNRKSLLLSINTMQIAKNINMCIKFTVHFL